MRDFKELKLWQRARKLAVAAHRLAARFPRDQLYLLGREIRRTALSLPANIAEGAGRPGRVEFIRFLYIALASGNELESHLLVAGDLGLIKPDELKALCSELVEIRRMIGGFIRYLKRLPSSAP